MELPKLDNLISLAFPALAAAAVLVLGVAMDIWGQATRERKNGLRARAARRSH